MSNISTTDARALFTKMLIDVYRERTAPTAFLRSFFPEKESPTKEISIEVQRGTEKIAVDVMRGTEGNRNSFNKSTEKIFVPPFYREYFDATELDLYDRLFGSTEIDNGIFNAFIESVADKLRMLQDKIERSYELQCAQVLETGIVTLESGINIDFKRKSASLVDLGSGEYWTNNGHDLYADFEAGCNFLRQKGKVQGGTINAILGSSALAALQNNSVFKERQNLFNMALDMVHEPQRNAVGATLHGRLSAGSYKINLWAYPQFYDNAEGASTPYIDPTKVILLPEIPRFVLSYAAVPQLLNDGAAPRKGAYVISNYIDERNTAHIFDIKSAGVAIPVAVDQIYTMKVVSE
jgi:hypothetical protein